MPSAELATADDDTDVLAAERAHLRRSREFLQLMRADVLSLRAMGGDPVSEEYLKAELYRRAESLRDMPDTPLFFGRLDYRDAAFSADPAAPETAAPETAAPETGARAYFHIGRRHVHDPHGTPVVIDWRAPVSRPFYRASQSDPLGLARRRRFGFAGGELTAFEDEGFGPGQAVTGPSRILIDEIERPRSGPMRDIVATIQPEQDDIVRASVDHTVCVQGAPGTGKTAVGLHRVAYLLYAHAQRLSRGGVIVVGPNRAFLAYIERVLPALGELDVTQLSVTDLTAAVPVGGTDSELAARIKGDARMATVLRTALWAQLETPAEAIVLVRGSRRWRVPVHEIAGLVTELRDRGVRYGTGREMLSHRIAHVILTRMEASGETCDDRTHESVRRSRTVQQTVAQVWPKTDPVRLVFRLLADPVLRGRAADGILDAAEQAAISWVTPPRGPGSARWSAADAVLIDEAADLIQRTPSLAHIVVDEAQDLSPIGLAAALAQECAAALQSPGSAAVIAADEQIPAIAEMLTQAGLPHAVLDGAAASDVISIVPVTLAKGLEFDQVIVIEPARIAAAEARGLHRLYVALTRAVSRLTVLHAEPLPRELAG
ncbi:MAG: ATP-binding domain-containing protein [Streptosporangiaceae bacterium]